MAQHDYDIANASGATVRADINTVLSAIASNNSGASAPATTFSFQWYADTTNDQLKIRNSANNAYITVGTLSAANLGHLTTAGGTLTDGANFVLGTTTGTKIGTATSQKLGFFNATPVIQPLITADLLDSLQAVGLIASGAGNTPLNLTDGAFECGSITSSTHTFDDAANIVVGTTTGTKIGTATTQKIGFYNTTPVVQGAAVADLTTTATTGTLPTANGSVTIADASLPTNQELLEYCVELESKLETLLARIRAIGIIAP
jgi:hypothetical protein